LKYKDIEPAFKDKDPEWNHVGSAWNISPETSEV
jgi:hypothetical protein